MGVGCGVWVWGEWGIGRDVWGGIVLVGWFVVLGGGGKHSINPWWGWGGVGGIMRGVAVVVVWVFLCYI